MNKAFVAAASLLASVEAKGALLIIDVQNCFTPPDGNLAVTGGTDIIPIINKMRVDYDGVLWDKVYVSQDWHCPKHVSFASVHNESVMSLKELRYTADAKLCKQDGGKVDFNTIFEADELADCSDPSVVKTTLNQTMWPDHCIIDTDGAKFHKNLTVKDSDFIQRKGDNCHIDSYSAFYGNEKLLDTGLTQVMKTDGITTVYVVGLASDYCVKFSSMDAQSGGFKTYMVKDASRGVTQPTVAQAYEQLMANNVSVIEVADLKKMKDDLDAKTTTKPAKGDESAAGHLVWGVVSLALGVGATINL